MRTYRRLSKKKRLKFKKYQHARCDEDKEVF